MWHIGCDKQKSGFGIYRMEPGEQKWKRIPGAGTRIAADGNGNALVVNKQGNVFHYTGKGWQPIPGQSVSDVGIGKEGTMWAVANDSQIFRRSKGKWELIQGSKAKRISVGPDGDAWIINEAGRPLHYSISQKKWEKQSGGGHDIGVAGDGSVWGIGPNKEENGFGIYTRKMTIPSKWQKVAGGATNISVDGSGIAYITNSSKRIFVFNGKRWSVWSGRANDIGVSPDGQMWVIGSNRQGGGHGIFRW